MKITRNSFPKTGLTTTNSIGPAVYLRFIVLLMRLLHNIYKLRSKCIVFRYGPLLSAGTASASLPWQRVCRRCSQRTVLVGLLQSSSAGSSDTCWDCALLVPSKTFVPAGVNGPPLQTPC